MSSIRHTSVRCLLLVRNVDMEITVTLLMEDTSSENQHFIRSMRRPLKMTIRWRFYYWFLWCHCFLPNTMGNSALNLLILSISSVFLLGIPCLCATLLTIRSIEHEHIITYYKLLCAYGYELQTLSFWGSPHHHFVFVDTLCLTGFFWFKSTDSGERHENYKTLICKFYAQGEFCVRGDACDFAHGAGELRRTPYYLMVRLWINKNNLSDVLYSQLSMWLFEQ